MAKSPNRGPTEQASMPQASSMRERIAREDFADGYLAQFTLLRNAIREPRVSRAVLESPDRTGLLPGRASKEHWLKEGLEGPCGLHKAGEEFIQTWSHGGWYAWGTPP